MHRRGVEVNMDWGRSKAAGMAALLLFGVLVTGSPLRGQNFLDGSFEGRTIRQIRVVSDGPLNSIAAEDLEKLIPFNSGDPYSISRAHIAILRLYSTELFHDVQFTGELVGDREVDLELRLIRR